ncbi:uncharacterized protein LOC128231491 [Mya arenaria]|uniref:uncharacterized protein LOC128231491 n=1 Tax=Mya arenaria TaxID=6604 RepID=UPI0022DF74A3|nr:uncharacterized protein LOC128231491 [Mya arenaria]XP_052800346.1 uncharacterized protein LOC128231491 [Mya arenaria]XP_052800347.1 uncharacterized protein LOC128231491 [Mya arenaria]
MDAGTLVWAKLEGHPWWPAMVSPSVQGAVTKADKTHVCFFSNPLTVAWIKEKWLSAFKGVSSPECQTGGKYFSTKKTFTSALDEAGRAEFLSKQERLQKYKVELKKPKAGTKQKKTGVDGPEPEKKKIVKTKAPIPKPGLKSGSKSGPKSRPNPGPKSGSKPGLKSGPNTSPKSGPKPGLKSGPNPGPKLGPKPGPKIGPKSKVKRGTAVVKESYSASGPIPKAWSTSFVLMNTADVPENLMLGQYLKVPTHSSSFTKIKIEMPDDFDQAKVDNEDDDDEEEVNDFDSEDELNDSDADPHYDPEDGTDKMSDEEILREESDFDSDEDPGWSPSSKKASSMKRKNVSKCQKNGAKKRRVASSSSSDSEEETSQDSSPKPASKKTSKVNHSSSSNAPSGPRNNLIITDNAPTGPEPTIGDFLLEKAECPDGSIPFLWRYKKGGLIQKFERKEEEGKVFYENIMSYSDWWACYAHKYQRVDVQVLFKFRNVEKVALVNKPTILPSEPVPTSTESDPAESSGNEKGTESEGGRTGSPQAQDGEVTSTTPEVNTDKGDKHEIPFAVGSFVMDKKDLRNVDNFPIWKIESQILIKKFDAVIKKGKMLHKAVKTYRGYKDIGKQYVSVEVRKLFDFPGEDIVEVLEESRPKLDLNTSMEEQYEKNPLLRHFYVYMQVLLSQALEPGFLDEVIKKDDPTYIEPMNEVNKLVQQKMANIERKARWADDIKTALNKCSYQRDVHKPDNKKICEAVEGSEDSVTNTVFLFGVNYNHDTLNISSKSHPCQEFRVGKTAMQYITPYHQLCHFKFNLYDKCKAKVKLVKEKEGLKEVEKIMDMCLGNKAWVLQNFEDFTALVEIT